MRPYLRIGFINKDASTLSSIMTVASPNWSYSRDAASWDIGALGEFRFFLSE